MIKYYFLFAFCFSFSLFSQQKTETLCHGKIIASVSNLEGVYVINSRTEKLATTDKNGNFSIEASVGDSLLFSSSQFQSETVVLTPEKLTSSPLLIKLEAIVNELKEVIVRQPELTAESLGIITYKLKKYTPAERKYHEASSGFGIHPILNYLSGRTDMLKKGIEVEKKEKDIEQLENYFEPHFYVNKLHIPADYVKGFLFFLVEKPEFTAILRGKNRSLIEFELSKWAVKYLELIQPKKE